MHRLGFRGGHHLIRYIGPGRAFIHEPDEISLVIGLCESSEDYWTTRVDYGVAGWSRSEAFMMVYDVMRDAGIAAILLNDAEDDETGISENLRPDDEVRH